MKSAVITGATGAIGMALIKKLRERNVKILVLARSSSPRYSIIPTGPDISVIDCSLKDLSSICNDSGEEYDVFFHLAWDGTFGESRNDMYVQNANVKYSLDAVEAAKRFGCRVFVGAGSQAEYGRCKETLTPRTPTFPENGYGYAKLCAGQMTRDHARRLGIRHEWCRILSVYGPYDGKNTMVSMVIQKLLNNERPSLTACEQIWDYIYSEDAAQALISAAEKGTDQGIYLIASGKSRPLREYVYDIRNNIDPYAELGIGEIEYSGKQVMNLSADISDLIKDTGYMPETSFVEGIRRTIQFIKGELN